MNLQFFVPRDFSLDNEGHPLTQVVLTSPTPTLLWNSRISQAPLGKVGLITSLLRI